MDLHEAIKLFLRQAGYSGIGQIERAGLHAQTARVDGLMCRLTVGVTWEQGQFVLCDPACLGER